MNSRVTKKGQVTIPSVMRRKYRIAEGTTVTFEETSEGLVIKPLPDIVDSAGKLSMYACADEVLKNVLKQREEEAVR
ncbi:MAG: AbrB/MazE/SpoVT family DNA-binding domain-containing protein [Thaumarchaeota archaeon]|nr:AbrB/MazE/SpoVT family DNA-binding domain-containing protein [Nitrososphaerota archaeon]MCL5318141.1 AbrB/MazE/SpoVT family DNA-binding domain-containing protein [Nitrososphaerota archaeon]